MIERANRAAALVAVLLLSTACSPEFGSKKWCENLAEKPKGEWTANEAGDYAKHCLFRSGDD